MDVPALHSLGEAMHTAFRQASPLGQLANALGAMVTQTLDNLQTFGPKSHVSRLSAGGLTLAGIQLLSVPDQHPIILP